LLARASSPRSGFSRRRRVGRRWWLALPGRSSSPAAMPVILASDAGGSSMMASAGGFGANRAFTRSEKEVYDREDCGERCGGLGKLCFEPENEMTAVNWITVGEGRGGYERVQRYSYVGQGCGSYEKVPVTTSYGSRIRPACIGLGIVLVLLSVICTMAAVLMPLLRPSADSTDAYLDSTTLAPTTSFAYDCAAKEPGPYAKQVFCCKKYGTHCEKLEAQAPTPAPVVTTRKYPPAVVQRGVPVAYPHAVATPAPLGICNVGGVLEWSVTKASYCCRHFGNGCPSPAPSQAPALFDCEAGFANWAVRWSVPQKLWCCSHTGKGCPEHTSTPVTHDCSARYATWEDSWAAGKKAWCCQHTGRGCTAKPRPTSHGGGNATAPVAAAAPAAPADGAPVGSLAANATAHASGHEASGGPHAAGNQTAHQL